MSKLYFRYGAMNCGKSSLLMQVAHNYNEKNKRVVVIKPAVDTKADNRLQSRIGLERDVDILIKPKESFVPYYDDWKNNSVECILVDESQFLDESQVDELWYVSKKFSIPVICYGLRQDFKGHLFVGSKRLLELADEVEELITICDCGKRAKFNARFDDEEFTLEGDTVVIDGARKNTKYVPMCGKCFLEASEKYRKEKEEKAKVKTI